MEADSTTYENLNGCKDSSDNNSLPFTIAPGNLKLYKDFIFNNGEKSLESQIVERLQVFGLLPECVQCLTSNPECKVVCKNARVIDRVQWVCETCGKRQSIRTGSFFMKLQCSIQQALQMVLAWCEDADMDVAAQHLGVKPRVANAIYEKLTDLAIKEYNKQKLGGENSVVLTEMYPECLNRLSPDTTDQPHFHRILMLADTNHIPTYYQLHVIKDDPKWILNGSALDSQALKSQVEQIVVNATEPNSFIVTGYNVPIIEGASSIQQLVEHCDADMPHFLTTRIWRQAITLCTASRDLCTVSPNPTHTSMIQRYLDTSLYRFRYGDGFYEHMLRIVSEEFTKNMT